VELQKEKGKKHEVTQNPEISSFFEIRDLEGIFSCSLKCDFRHVTGRKGNPEAFSVQNF